MEYLLNQFVNGICQGSIYALMAIGYSVIVGVVGMVTFTYGEIMMIGAFGAFYSFQFFGNNLPLAIFMALSLQRSSQPSIRSMRRYGGLSMSVALRRGCHSTGNCLPRASKYSSPYLSTRPTMVAMAVPEVKGLDMEIMPAAEVS